MTISVLLREGEVPANISQQHGWLSKCRFPTQASTPLADLLLCLRPPKLVWPKGQGKCPTKSQPDCMEHIGRFKHQIVRPISHHFSPRNLRARPTTYNFFSPQHRSLPDPPGHPMAPWPVLVRRIDVVVPWLDGRSILSPSRPSTPWAGAPPAMSAMSAMSHGSQVAPNLEKTWENLMRTSYVFLSCGNSMKISGGFWWPIHEEHHPLNEATWRAWVYWSCALHLGIWGHCAICCQPKMSIVEAWFVAIFGSDTKSFDFEVTPNSFQSWHLDISIHFLSKSVQKHDVHSVDPGASRAYASIAADLPMENVCIHLSVFADVLWSSKWKFIHQGAKVCQKSQRSGEFQGRMDNLAHRGCTIGIKIQVAHTLLKKITGRLHWSKIPNIPKAESTITAFLANIDNIFAVPWIIDCICISNFPGNVTIPRQNDLQLTNPLSSHWATDSANTWPHVGR